jgi:hypothetical protein
MTTVREPLLEPVAISDLRPTQITVGMREVKAKRKHWRDESGRKGEEFLGKHLIPVILGPKHRHYVIDHHHLARALHDEGVKRRAGIEDGCEPSFGPPERSSNSLLPFCYPTRQQGPLLTRTGQGV